MFKLQCVFRITPYVQDYPAFSGHPAHSRQTACSEMPNLMTYHCIKSNISFSTYNTISQLPYPAVQVCRLSQLISHISVRVVVEVRMEVGVLGALWSVHRSTPGLHQDRVGVLVAAFGPTQRRERIVWFWIDTWKWKI